LDGDGNIKVGDFGLAEDVYIRGYFRQDKYDAIKVPYRWMAPESLRDGLFSEKSDVVSAVA
jgi:serine/threonine protein kinase